MHYHKLQRVSGRLCSLVSPDEPDLHAELVVHALGDVVGPERALDSEVRYEKLEILF